MLLLLSRRVRSLEGGRATVEGAKMGSGNWIETGRPACGASLTVVEGEDEEGLN